MADDRESQEEEAPIQPPIDSESWCRSVVTLSLICINQNRNIAPWPSKLASTQSFNFDRTKISEDVKHTFAWTIERFSERQEPNSQFLWSSKFTIRGPDEQVSHFNLVLSYF